MAAPIHTPIREVSGPAIYQALAIKHALRLYIKTGIRANRAYTPANMARMARVITGKPVRSTNLPECLAAMEEWLEKAVRPNAYEEASR